MNIEKYRSHVKLTDKERRIVELLCQGVSPKEVGTRITPKIQRRNVHLFLRRVKDKLGARTTYQACAIYAALHPDSLFDTHSSVESTMHCEHRR